MNHQAEPKAARSKREGAAWLARGPVLGMACMLAATALFATMIAMIRGISAAVPPMEIAFFRFFFGLLLNLPPLVWLGARALRTTRLRLHAVRGGVQAVSSLFFFVAVTLIPLAQTTALEFASPIIATVLAVAFLGEKVKARRIAALAVGFLGVLVVIRPGVSEVSLGQLLFLVSVFLWAMCQLMIRELSRTESAFTQGFYMVVFMTPVTALAAIPGWVWPAPSTLIWLAGLAFVGTLGMWLYGEAFRRAEMSANLPLEATKIIWTASFGWWLFSESIDVVTILGGFIVFAAAAYITIREARVRETPAPETPVD